MNSPINNTTAAGSVAPMESMNTEHLITAENVLSYCASRLNALDELIQARFTEQQRRNEALKSMNRTMEILNRYNNGQSKGAAGCNDVHIQQGKDLCEVYNNTKDPEARNRVAQAYAMVTGNDISKTIDPKTGLAVPSKVSLEPSKIAGATAEEWARKVNDFKTSQDSLSKDNELSMIQLQSIISQRQLAIQLTTQMMAAMHDAKKGIVANIRA